MANSSQHSDQDQPSEALSSGQHQGLKLLKHLLEHQQAHTLTADLRTKGSLVDAMPLLIEVARGNPEMLNTLERDLGVTHEVLKDAALSGLKEVYLKHIDDPCRVLGLNPWSSAQAAQVRYRQLIRLFHPDRNLLNDRDQADRMTAHVNLAYQQFCERYAKSLNSRQARTGAAQSNNPAGTGTSHPNPHQGEKAGNRRTRHRDAQHDPDADSVRRAQQATTKRRTAQPGEAKASAKKTNSSFTHSRWNFVDRAKLGHWRGIYWQNVILTASLVLTLLRKLVQMVSAIARILLSSITILFHRPVSVLHKVALFSRRLMHNAIQYLSVVYSSQFKTAKRVKRKSTTGKSVNNTQAKTHRGHHHLHVTSRDFGGSWRFIALGLAAVAISGMLLGWPLLNLPSPDNTRYADASGSALEENPAAPQTEAWLENQSATLAQEDGVEDPIMLSSSASQAEYAAPNDDLPRHPDIDSPDVVATEIPAANDQSNLPSRSGGVLSAAETMQSSPQESPPALSQPAPKPAIVAAPSHPSGSAKPLSGTDPSLMDVQPKLPEQVGVTTLAKSLPHPILRTSPLPTPVPDRQEAAVQAPDMELARTSIHPPVPKVGATKLQTPHMAEPLVAQPSTLTDNGPIVTLQDAELQPGILPTQQQLDLALAGFIGAIADGDLGQLSLLLADTVSSDNRAGKRQLMQSFSRLFETTTERDLSLLGLHWVKQDGRMIGTTKYQLQLRHLTEQGQGFHQGIFRLEWIQQQGRTRLIGFYHHKDPLFQ